MPEELERKQLIEEINKIRAKLGLGRYSQEYLESLSLKELWKLYKIQEALIEPIPEKKKFDKRILLIPVVVGIIITIFLSLSGFVPSNLEIILGGGGFGGFTRNLTNIKYGISFLDSGDAGSSFILINYGDQINSFKVYLNGNYTAYEIVENKLPIKKNESLKFSISNNLCDNKTHEIKVEIGDKNESLIIIPEWCSEL